MPILEQRSSLTYLSNPCFKLKICILISDKLDTLSLWLLLTIFNKTNPVVPQANEITENSNHAKRRNIAEDIPDANNSKRW